MLPVVPAFFAQLMDTSLGAPDLKLWGVLASATFFVLGFSAVFAVLGVVLNAVLAEAATEVLTWLSRLADAVVILARLRAGVTS
jgi:cytochrome c biogenesis protein CcdA